MTLIRRLPPLPSTRDVLRMYGIKARKMLSQNFLLDPRTLDKLARTAGHLQGKTVVEVGPGPGGITRAIIGNGAREVHVIEKDPRFLQSLQLLQEATGNILHINMGDVLNYNMSKLFSDELRRDWFDVPPDVHLIGNLPFNIATPFLIKLLRSMQQRDNIFSYGRVPLLLTFQHEVACRMIAGPKDPARSRLSFMCQNYAKVSYKYTLPGGAFVPPPKVDVGVVTLLPLRKPYIDLPFKFVERVITAVFRGKQKNIRNSARNLFPDNMLQRKFVAQLLALAAIESDRQPVSLTMDEMERIAFVYKDMCDKDPIIDTYIQKDCKIETLDYQLENRIFLQNGEETPITEESVKSI